MTKTHILQYEYIFINALQQNNNYESYILKFKNNFI